MMKIGVSYDPYGKIPACFGEERFAKLKSFGFSAIDYKMAGTRSELYAMSDGELEQKLTAERKALEAAGLVVSQVHGPWRSPPRDATEEDRQERMEKMKRSILAARLLGCKNWVIHPIMPYGALEIDTEDAPKTWEMNKAFLTELLQYAKEQDVTICLENMPMRKFSMGSPEQVLKFVKEMNDDHFKICLDSGHSMLIPDLCLSDVVRRMGNELKVLHIHDNMGDRDFHLWPTKGIVDWPAFMKALKDIDFQGVFSLETAPDSSLEPEEFEKQFIELAEITKNLTKLACE